MSENPKGFYQGAPSVAIRHQSVSGADAVFTGSLQHGASKRSPRIGFQFEPRADALAQLEKLAKLPDSWDGPSAQAPSGQTLVAVRRHICAVYATAASATAWIAAAQDGSIGVDWRLGGRTAAITFAADGSIEFAANGPAVEYWGPLTVEDLLVVEHWLLRGGDTLARFKP